MHTLTLMLWFDTYIVHVRDSPPSSILSGDPKHSYAHLFKGITNGEEVVVRGCETQREKFVE